MNDEYILSVIVCCYNKSKTLELTLESLIHQSIFDKIEVICVDDCSTDNSLHILESYRDKYSNFKVRKLEQNSSVYVARLEGLAISTSRYIGFLDPDDWIDEKYFQELVDEIQKTDADMIITPSIYKHTNKEEFISLDTDKIRMMDNPGVYDNTIELFNKLMATTACMTLWNIVFKRKAIIPSLELKRAYISYTEDNLFFIFSLMHSDRIEYYRTSSVYHYYYGNDVNHLSCNTPLNKMAWCLDYVFNLLLKYCMEHEEYNKYFDGIKKCKDKYPRRIIYTLHTILVNGKIFNKYFNKDFTPKDDFYELAKIEANKKELKSIQEVLSVIQNLKDIIRDNA